MADRPASPSLRALNGSEADRVFPIDRELVVGRAETADLCIADPRLSRRHARFFVEGEHFLVEDLGSPNGTLVNDRRVTRAELESGDIVVLGKTRFEVLRPPALGAETSPTSPRERPDPFAGGPELVKPARQSFTPSLEAMVADEYFAALGIGDQTLLEARADQLEALLVRTRNFAILHEVSKAIQKEQDTREMLGRVLDLLLKITRGERAFAALSDEDGNLHPEVARGARGPIPGSSFTISQTVFEHVLRGRSAVICADRASDARFQDSASLMLSDTRALMAVPILVNNRVLGLLQIEQSHLVERFDEDDLDLLSVAASTVGVALDNLKLAEERVRTIEALRTAQAQLLETQDRLIRSEQLAAIGRLATGIAHEVKNHLSPFVLADVIARQYPDDRKIRDAAEMMREAQQYILDLVNEIRAFAQGGQSAGERRPEALEEVVERVLRFVQYDRAVAKARIGVEIEARPIVQLDEKGFRQVLINLIKNAADALPERGGAIRVRIAEERGRAIVEVIDNGRGIPKEIAAHIFDPFFTTKGEHGLGLGLDISRRIVADHGGELSFDSEPGRGTTFRIALPLTDDAGDTDPPEFSDPAA